MTFKELAFKVLQEEKRPLSAREIWDIGMAKGYAQEVGSSGKTPWYSVGAQIYVDIRDNPETPFSKLSKQGKFYLIGLVDEEIVESSVEETEAGPKRKKKTEAELHKYLTYFVYKQYKISTKTINHQKSIRRPKNLNKWKHPDVVGVFIPNWENAVTDLAKNISVNGAKFYSYELKLELNTTNLRQHYFQAVSNSSWANESYLVAETVSDDPEFLDEFKKLNNSFGIGLIQISTEDENESKILFLAKERKELDFDTINDLTVINADFERFLKDVAGKIDRPGYTIKVDKVLEYDELY